MADFNLNVKAVEKLLDYTASGVGAIAGPILALWRASREGKARLIAARADADIRRIEAESEAETSPIIAQARSQARRYLMSPDADVRGTVEVTRRDIVQRVEYQERKRLANIRSVVEDAADELGDKEVPDHEPDPDWTARFFNEVQDVSSEDMQKIWAKILAGEVESPGRTSLRTLDTLRDMTKNDAKMFMDICDFVVRNDFVFYGDSVKGFEALNYSNLLHLQDCGLINVGPDLVKKFMWGESKQIVLMYHGGALLVTGNSDNDEALIVPDILLTTAGKELSRFVKCALHMEYLQAFSRFLNSKNCQLAHLEGASPLPDGGLWYANCVSIEPKSESPEDNTS